MDWLVALGINTVFFFSLFEAGRLLYMLVFVFV